MKKYITKALTDRKENLIDDRHIFLHMDFTLSRQGVLELVQSFMEMMFFPLDKDFVYEITTENGRRASMANIMQIFQSDLNEGMASICMEIYKKTETIRSLATVSRFEDDWYSSDTFLVKEEYRKKQEVLKQRMEKALAAGDVEKDIINQGSHVTAGEPGFSDLAVFLNCEEFEYDSSQIFGCLEFSVSVYSLGKNVDAAAAYLVRLLKELCAIDRNIGGFVSMGVYHASEKKEFFFYYDDGYMISDDGKKLSAREWLHLNYAENIEWFNILSPAAAEKLTDMKLLKASEDVIFEELPDGRVALGIKKELTSFRAKDWEPYYKWVRECQKPGYSEDEILQSLLLERDLYFAPDEYRIEGDMIYFSRGIYPKV